MLSESWLWVCALVDSMILLRGDSLETVCPDDVAEHIIRAANAI